VSPTDQTMTRTIRVGHSPDPDDAFMFHGIAAGKVDCAGFAIEQVLEDIESLNRRALAGELEVSAVSIHAYTHLSERYALMPCGASMGDGYGPCVVTREPMDTEKLRGATIAIPGTLTSAYLALRMFLGEFRFEVLPFDEILDAVVAGRVDAGLIIHEGQLTYAGQGLHLVVDLGQWWTERTDGLPLPLGGNVVRTDLGDETVRRLTRVIGESIAYGLDHREEALDYAMDFGRGLDRKLADRFVGMYVNELTRDYGDRGRRGIERFLEEGRATGLLPREFEIRFVE
jgi:1,4-dihydroxy-6-naphthoate synthase